MTFRLGGGALAITVMFGIGVALCSEITLSHRAVAQSNFHDDRMPDAPRAIHVELVDSDAPPGGIGEPGRP